MDATRSRITSRFMSWLTPRGGFGQDLELDDEIRRKTMRESVGAGLEPTQPSGSMARRLSKGPSLNSKDFILRIPVVARTTRPRFGGASRRDELDPFLTGDDHRPNRKQRGVTRPRRAIGNLTVRSSLWLGFHGPAERAHDQLQRP